MRYTIVQANCEVFLLTEVSMRGCSPILVYSCGRYRRTTVIRVRDWMETPLIFQSFFGGLTETASDIYDHHFRVGRLGFCTNQHPSKNFHWRSKCIMQSQHFMRTTDTDGKKTLEIHAVTTKSEHFAYFAFKLLALAANAQSI